MTSNAKKFQISARVDYVDTDAMQVMHHASYFRYLERCRVEWLRSQGLDYKNLESQGYALPLRSAEIKYLKPLVFDDLFEVTLGVGVLQNSRFILEYEIYREGVLCTTARTEHVCCKFDGGKLVPIKIPEEWKGSKTWQELDAQK